MNTRGLTELIVLNLALEQGVISQALFAMLVIMALVTTFMTGPLLRLLDPHNELGEPPGRCWSPRAEVSAPRRGRSRTSRSWSRRRPTARCAGSSPWPSRWRAPSRRAS